MLIYNFRKEFVGMDEKDLKTLGFKDLAGLRTEVTDFADLFVKTPGYVHNFKHVHWIDFIACTESSEESKVIINVSNKNYKCVLQITTSYLVDNPASKAYIITLNNLRELNASESESISGDIRTREIPQKVTQSQEVFNTPQTSNEFETPKLEEEIQTISNVTEDPYETLIEIDLDVEDEAFDEEIATTTLDNNLEIDEKLDLDDMSLDITFEDDLSASIEVEEESIVKTQTVQENFDNGYTYNPKVASDELGLPLDLIEEFIQDFIEQAKEFKESLYRAFEVQDLDSLKILSHKLKGVAANLRIEDALETLSTINTSNDLNIIEENLNIFYNIVSKLAGEEISVIKKIETQIIQEPIPKPVEETLNISFEDKPKEIEIEEEDDLYSDLIEVKEESLELLETKSEDQIEEPIKISYSKKNIANEIGIDEESFNELFDDYIQEASDLKQSIQAAIVDNDLHTCKNSALKLKGMSDNMRITAFSNELETIIYASSTQDIQDSLNTIVTALAELSN